MLDTVMEEVVKGVFGDSWLSVGVAIVAVIAIIKFVRDTEFPAYFRNCLIACWLVIIALIEVYILKLDEYPWVGKAVIFVIVALILLIFILNYSRQSRKSG